MAIKSASNGKYQLTVQCKKLFPGRVYYTFDNYEDALQYELALKMMFAKGVVPDDLFTNTRASQLERATNESKSRQIRHIIRAYLATGIPALSDETVLQLLRNGLDSKDVLSMDFEWANAWVTHMKMELNYLPSTIRKRIGSLSRVLDWYIRTNPGVVQDSGWSNPLKLLPRGAATYNRNEAIKVELMGKVAKTDAPRDRRLTQEEFDRIWRVVHGLPGYEGGPVYDYSKLESIRVLFITIYFTGMRLREAYTLTRKQIDFDAGVISVNSSKQWHGRKATRVVPMRLKLASTLKDYFIGLRRVEADSPIFPWWSPSMGPRESERVSGHLSHQFARIFSCANVEDMREHDLRHEATCQWFEMKNTSGQWMFREREIQRIMGWSASSHMVGRYASFRGEDMAARMREEA